MFYVIPVHKIIFCAIKDKYQVSSYVWFLFCLSPSALIVRDLYKMTISKMQLEFRRKSKRDEADYEDTKSVSQITW